MTQSVSLPQYLQSAVYKTKIIVELNLRLPANVSERKKGEKKNQKQNSVLGASQSFGIFNLEKRTIKA